MSLKKKIYLFREAKGLTQSDVAKALKMCVTKYGDIERGDIDNDPKLSELQKIANFYGTRLSDLLDDSDESCMRIHFAMNRDKNQNNVYLGSSANRELEKQLIAAKDEKIADLNEIIGLLKARIADLEKQLSVYQSET